MTEVTTLKKLLRQIKDAVLDYRRTVADVERQRKQIIARAIKQAEQRKIKKTKDLITKL